MPSLTGPASELSLEEGEEYNGNIKVLRLLHRPASSLVYAAIGEEEEASPCMDMTPHDEEKEGGESCHMSANSRPFLSRQP